MRIRRIAAIACALVAWTGVVALAVRYSTGYAHFGLLPLLGAMLAIPIVLIGAVIWLRWGRRGVINWGAIQFVFFASAVLVSIKIGDWQVRRTKLVGLTIVDALDRFAAQRGAYPATLDSLIPVFLSEIPVSCVGTGEPFGYWRDDSGGFGLTFDRPAFLFSIYRSSDRQWLDRD